MTGFRVVIPARYAAARLPGKPLLDIGGRSMIHRVWEQARASGADQVVVATDDPRVEAAVRAFGGEVLLTRSDHGSGSERIAEVTERLAWPDDTVVINLQGDEPFMPPRLLRQLAEGMSDEGEDAPRMATLCVETRDGDRLRDPHTVKVVRDCRQQALYFSRAPIPWSRCWDERGPTGQQDGGWHLHLGIYAYRVDTLRELVALPACAAEREESLEQLRALHHGIRIRVLTAQVVPLPGIDTPEDLGRARRHVAAAESGGNGDRPSPGRT